MLGQSQPFYIMTGLCLKITTLVRRIDFCKMMKRWLFYLISQRTTGGKNEHGGCLGTLQHHHRLLLPCLNGNMRYCILRISISIATRKRALKGVCLAYFCFQFSPLVVRLDFVTMDYNIQIDSHLISKSHRDTLCTHPFVNECRASLLFVHPKA